MYVKTKQSDESKLLDAMIQKRNISWHKQWKVKIRSTTKLHSAHENSLVKSENVATKVLTHTPLTSESERYLRKLADLMPHDRRHNSLKEGESRGHDIIMSVSSLIQAS